MTTNTETMKKYFAKYLPVEGEIKEVGDVALYSNGFSETVSEDTLPDLIDNPACKKARLFLCSRDIQVGDKVWWDDPDNGYSSDFYTVDDISGEIMKINSEYSEAEVFEHETVKVIGEIFPDALSYVKEVDEFDEDEVEMFYYDPEELEEYDWYQANHEEMLGMGFTAYARVKGPCGHFH